MPARIDLLQECGSAHVNLDSLPLHVPIMSYPTILSIVVFSMLGHLLNHLIRFELTAGSLVVGKNVESEDVDQILMKS